MENRTESAYEVANILIKAGIANMLNEVTKVQGMKVSPFALAGFNTSDRLDDILKLLLNSGADPNSTIIYFRDSNQKMVETALYIIARYGDSANSIKAIETLLNAGCDPNKCSDDYNWTAGSTLFQAIHNTNRYSLAKVKLLLEYGASIKNALPYEATVLSNNEDNELIFNVLNEYYPLSEHEDWWQGTISRCMLRCKTSNRILFLNKLIGVGWDINGKEKGRSLVCAWPLICNCDMLTAEDVEWLINMDQM